MAYPLHVAFVWHQHQPLYKSREIVKDTSGQYRLPWVRLHGTKDYLDLMLILERYPRLHQTVNLVPSLLLQLEDYAQGVAIDPYLAVTLTPETQFSLVQKHFILEHFFDANHHTLIDPHPRYAQLYHQRQEQGMAWCLENWTLQDYSDLLAWHNLAWIDPIFWDDHEIAQWLKRGKNFTLSDRQRIISKQRQIIRRIIPQHRAMQESGQIEITTSPYTHPILPLIADTYSAKVAVPQMQLPQFRFQWTEDVTRHLQKAWNLYTEYFNCSPKGLWPSEESVSPEILPFIAKQGFQWLCSDEGVLGYTLNHFFHRNEVGNLMAPELLYRPYRLETPQGDLAIVFRDHRLSDLIGFTYANMDARTAALDLIGHLEAISRSLLELQKDGTALAEPWLVTIALDGENCWEHYPQDGLRFLNELYSRLSDHDGLDLVTVSEFLHKFPPKVALPASLLHSGSWIDANFTTWIGDPIKNKAWDYLTAAREIIAYHPEATPENNPEVWDALDAAEGSDWFWWFGEGHSCSHDAMFDQLFREHLTAIYRALNEPIPPYLRQPLEDHHARQRNTPESFIHPVIDGFGDEQDWAKAGYLDLGGSRGTMHRSSDIQHLYYGWDHLNFYLRLDLRKGIKVGQDLPHELHLLWYYPGVDHTHCPAPLADLPEQAPLNFHFHYHLGINLLTETTWLEEAQDSYSWHPRPSHAKACLNQCLEIAVPWGDLQIYPGYRLHLIGFLAEQGQFKDSIPENDFIILQMP
jgi:alpha-amylase/alpha-mannosidase (GH57 family)